MTHPSASFWSQMFTNDAMMNPKASMMKIEIRSKIPASALNVPVCVGVPEMTTIDVFTVTPVGNVPETY